MIKFVIYLQPITKKNHQQIIYKKLKGKQIPIIIQSKSYQQYEKECRYFMPKIEAITKPINIKAVYYMKTRRKVDLTNLNSALHDILVKYKVIEDDNRDIAAMTDGSMVLYDKDNPRTEVEITYLTGYEQWKKENNE